MEGDSDQISQSALPKVTKANGISGCGYNPQNPAHYERTDRFVPTTTTASILIALSMAANEGKRVHSADIKAAYLNVDLIPVDTEDGEFERVVEIDAKTAAQFRKVNAEKHYWEQYMRPEANGKLYFVINKAFYGLLESVKLWYDTISGF